MKEKYIGKSTGLSGEASETELIGRKKLDIDIAAPQEITAEEHNSTLMNISSEVGNAKLLGPNLIVRFKLFTDSMVDALYDKVPTESGTQMDAKRLRPYQDYGVVVKRGLGCTLPKEVKPGTIVRISPTIAGNKKMNYMMHTSGAAFENYFLLNENLIAWYE